MEKLTGGFINDCIKRDGVVVKTYQNDTLCDQVGGLRRKRESMSLRHFGNGKNISPTLVYVDQNTLVQEFIEGSVLESNENTPYDLESAGRLLRSIHSPVSRPFAATEQYYKALSKKAFTKSKPILDQEGLSPQMNIDWNKVAEAGTTRVHRDFWFGNIIKTNTGAYKAIDWEFSGIGSPYEDFSIVDLWVFPKHGFENDFWKGYGYEPDPSVRKGFLTLKLMEFIGRISPTDYLNESSDGFYHNKVELLKQL